MKRTVAAALMALTLAGCAQHTEYGDCIGAFDDKRPELVYKLSVRNLVMGVLFFQLVVPPVVVLASETLCPVGTKEDTNVLGTSQSN